MKKTVLIVIRVVCIVGFLVCVGVLGWYWHSDRSDRAVAEALAAAHDAASAEAMEQVRAVATDNADTIGWLRIDGTNINNVVMFAPDTPGKYLHMDFYGKWSYRGTLYVAENCDVRTADNILIYGHHMKDGSMFGSLISYKDAAFRAAHPIVQFDTLYASHSYEVVAAIETQIPAEGSDAFRYYGCVGTDAQQFAQYLAFIEQNRCYDTGITIQPGDRLLTLSTCAYPAIRPDGGVFNLETQFRAAFACSHRAVNAAGSWIAVSESILRFMSMPASFRPCIKVE